MLTECLSRCPRGRQAGGQHWPIPVRQWQDTARCMDQALPGCTGGLRSSGQPSLASHQWGGVT